MGKVVVAMGCHSSNIAPQQEQAVEEQAAGAPCGAAASPRAAPNLTFRRAVLYLSRDRAARICNKKFLCLQHVHGSQRKCITEVARC